jgi:branched-chain amino acid transport system ATP-binding protein
VTSSPLLAISGLTAGYSGLSVLDNLSFEIGAGEFVAIVGPNGHGKSTLLKTISGLVRSSRGSIVLGGVEIAKLRADRIVAAGIIHVPQGDLLFPDMTVNENLLMGAYLADASVHVGQRLEEVYSLLPRLRERQDQIASTLSGGERRMTGIGRGLMGGGQVLMLDEPSLGLAPIIIDQIYALIDDLKARGRTIVLVEENAARIFERADRVYLLDNGRFVWSGSGSELMRRPEVLETYLGG